jgi:cytosine/adenosine deaminase-related metal-dependent hydrolase
VQERLEGTLGRLTTQHLANKLHSVSIALYKEMTSISKEKNIPITMHCAEVKADREFFSSLSPPQTPMSYCSSVGLLGPSTVLVHMVHLEDSDIAALAETGAHVAHCPTSNAKLASGVTRVPDLLKAGVNVGLGTEELHATTLMILLQEMKLAGIVHKAVSYDPTLVPAETVLEMATINGAKALGLADDIGSIEVGKKADFVALDMGRVNLQPYYSAVSAVVYSATGGDVTLTIVDGKIVVEKGKLVTIDEEEVWKEADKRGHEVVKRAGLTESVKSRWPTIISHLLVLEFELSRVIVLLYLMPLSIVISKILNEYLFIDINFW